MRAVVMREIGDPDVLGLEDVERPQIDAGEVLVRVRAASVNPFDWKVRRGLAETALPAVLGSDISGTVLESRVEDLAEGEDVFGIAASGGYSELATAKAVAIARRPAGISHEQAAALPVAGLTAWQALFDRGGLKRGETVLIAGAAGGVGHLAVQFAVHQGARVIATGSSRNRDFVLGLGAHEYVDYATQNAADTVSEVDLAFDVVGGETTRSLVPVVRGGGRLVTIAGMPPQAEAQERDIQAELLVMSPNASQLIQIAQLVADGDVRVEITKLLDLADIRQAHELIESGHTRGKIVLRVG